MSLASRRRARGETQGRQKTLHGLPAQLLENFSTPDAVGKLVRGAAVKHGGHNIVTGRAVYSVSGKVKDRKVLGMAVNIADEEIEEGLFDEEALLNHRVDRLVEQPINGDRIEAPPLGAPAFVFLPGREPQGLAEIFLMAAHNPAILIDLPIKSLYGQNGNTAYFHDACGSGRETK